MEDLVVPFIFVPKGDPEPTEWLAQHPGAIKIPAVFVPRGRGRDAQLKVDLNSALERMARDAGLADDLPVPEHTDEAPPAEWVVKSRQPDPEDPVTVYLRTDQAAAGR